MRMRSDGAPRHAGEFFVFAGAGVSVSPPACLPMFNWLRDAVLIQLRLAAYVAGRVGCINSVSCCRCFVFMDESAEQVSSSDRTR